VAGGPLVVGLAVEPLPGLLAAVRAAAAAGGREADVRLLQRAEDRAAHLAEVEVLYGHLSAGEVARAPRLRWVHVASAGVDRLPLAELAAAGITLTNARGLYDEAMAEHALALLLAMVRRIPEAAAAQAHRAWVRLEPGLLADGRLGILGYGSIGRAVAVRARPFVREIWALRAHPQPDPLVARVFGPGRDELLTFLSGCQHLVAVLPSTPATRGLLDAEALAALPRGAYLVNVGRGDLLVEADLDRALRTGHLAAAALDCPPRDPLPADSPLWDAPGVLITPHVGGARPGTAPRAIALFADNLTRYVRGEPLAQRVDLAAGY
jgi:phosphoglycerate dehydrogenase-like enzyme